MHKCFWISFILAFNNVFCGSDVSVPERLFKMTNSQVNVSHGDLLYKSQAAGYYSGGGGMVMRSPVKSINFVNIQTPKIQAGCGGIDIYTGGLSFVSGEELVKTLQSISSNAAGFAFMLGLETVSPTIANTMRQLQSWANTMNGIGINSCETAAQLVGSVWPANEMASQHVCSTVGTTGLFRDQIEARHKCSSEKDTHEAKKKMKENFPLDVEYNIAWEALMAQPFFKDPANKELAEMYMTLVGTVIVIDENVEALTYFSKAEDSDFLTKLLEGGKITKYTCGDNQCLTIKEVEKEISSADSWFVKIRDSLNNMQMKIVSDIPLDQSEKGLLSTSRLPLFKIVNVLSAYHRGSSCALELDNIANIVSWDVLAQIINEALDTVRRGCVKLRGTSMYSTRIDYYLSDLDRVQKVVQRYESHAQKAIDLEMRLIQKIQLLEKQINSEIMVN